MFGIPVRKNTKTKNEKNAISNLLFVSRYPNKEQAEKARYALIRIAGIAHFAPCDTNTGKEEKFEPNPKWSIGEIIEC